MSIQILQYEFLGPIRLDEWGPPMEKVVYLILSRVKDSFNIVYVGDCEKTEEKNFFVNNPNFKHISIYKPLYLEFKRIKTANDSSPIPPSFLIVWTHPLHVYGILIENQLFDKKAFFSKRNVQDNSLLSHSYHAK